MPTTHALLVMNFVNGYGEFEAYDHVVADDPMARVLVKDIEYYVKYVRGYGGFPERPLLLLDKEVHNILVIVMRSFKPDYWSLRGVTWGFIELGDIMSYVEKLQGLQKQYISYMIMDTGMCI
jgi:hypothetical protein